MSASSLHGESTDSLIICSLCNELLSLRVHVCIHVLCVSLVYRDHGGWPYILKIRVSMAVGTQSGIRLHERVPLVKIWGSSKNDQNWTTEKWLKL